MKHCCPHCKTEVPEGAKYCPRCQRPTAANAASALKPNPGPPLQPSVPDRTERGNGQQKSSRSRRIGIAVAFGIIALAVAGGAAQKVRQYRWDIPRRTMERIKGEPDDIVKRRADHDPLYAAEWGFRLLRDAFEWDGDTIPLVVIQKRMDKAGRVLLQAMEEIKGNPEYEDHYGNYYSHCVSKLGLWRNQVVKHPEISRIYQQDTAFRNRVDSFFPNHEEYDRLFNNAR